MFGLRYASWPLLAVLYCLVAYAPAAADQTIRCESEHFGYTRCPVDTRGEVRLVRQLSDADCRRGDTWGYDRRGVWVDEGCAGEFQIGRRRDSDDSGWRSPSRDRDWYGSRHYDDYYDR